MTFSKPPIVEAIFHLVVERDSDFDHESLNNYAKSVTENSSVLNEQEKRFLRANISFDSNDLNKITSSLSNDLEGYVISSADGSKIVQANISSFSFSKLQIYESWEVFYAEATEFWEKYIEITSVKKIKRLSLRYLNRIMIPLDKTPCRLQDYIKVLPEVSDDLSMIISGYFMQISLSSKIYEPSKAIVNQTIGEDGNSSFPLIFDIEVFRDVDISPDDSSIESIFSENLRPFKNDIFLNGITEKTREFFK
jgi:uncharacterized protein (TIGR04255 family)